MFQKSIQLVILLFLFIAFGNNGNAQSPSDQLLQLHVEGEKIKANNISKILSKISSEYKVPIGFEPESKINTQNAQEKTQPSSADNMSQILLNDGSLKEVLDELVNLYPQYCWEIINGVVNIYPKSNRDSALKEILGTKINSFSYEKIKGIMNLGSLITDTPEVKSVLKSLGLDSIHFLTSDELSRTENGGVVTKYQFSKPVEKSTSSASICQFNNVTVREILNKSVETTSSRKFWTIIMWGESKSFITIISH